MKEIVDRPLFTRMMQVPKYKLAYKAEYRLALTTYLEKNLLFSHIDSVAAYVQTGYSSQTFTTSVTDIKNFITTRTTVVNNQLNAYIGIKEDAPRPTIAPASFCMSRNADQIAFNNPLHRSVTLSVFSIEGKLVIEKLIPGTTAGTLPIHTNGLLIFKAVEASGRISTGKISAVIR